MSTKHTPGPWTFDEKSIPGDFVNGPDDSIVADTFFAGDHDIGVANARLISAAPELLEVLQKLADLADGFNVSGVYFNEQPDCRSALFYAYAVISKATGAA